MKISWVIICFVCITLIFFILGKNNISKDFSIFLYDSTHNRYIPLGKIHINKYTTSIVIAIKEKEGTNFTFERIKAPTNEK